MAITQDSRSVMAQLRMMGDTELRQYAAMHKNDPFIFPLAFQESQMRQQVRNEAQAMQPPQPKVADQALASMAAAPMPEDVGIGALDAPNLNGIARGAAGGIVAFDEGGEVPRFQVGGVPPSAGTQFAIPGMVTGTPILPQAGYTSPDDMTTWEKIQAYRKARQAEREDYKRKQGAPASAAYTPSTVDPFAYDQASLPMPAAAAAKTGTGAPTGADKGAPSSGTGLRQNTTGLGLTAIPALTQTGTGTMSELQAMREQMGGPSLTYAQQQGIKDLETASRESKEAGLKELEADIAARGPGMTGAEKRATERGERLDKRELELPGLAMFEAGMAMMAGESPFALVNIGKGAGIGMKSYTAGLEKLQESRDKLDESFDKIEQFRENRADMNAKEVRAAKADIRQTQVEAKRLAYDALSKNGEMDRQDVRAAFDTMQRNRATMYEVASRERLGIAQIQAHRDIAASQPDRVLWESLLRANNNDPTAAYQALTKLKTEKFNPYQSYADYLKAFAGKENVLTPPMGFTQYASQFTVPSYSFDALPGNASTRPPIK